MIYKIVLGWNNSYWASPSALLHAGDGRGGRFCLVPELLKPVRLALLVDKRFNAGGGTDGPPASGQKTAQTDF